MCGIAGWIQLSNNPSNDFPNYFAEVCHRIYARGPDCFGIAGVGDDGKLTHSHKFKDRDIAGNILWAVRQVAANCDAALVNFRGIPTTEHRGVGFDAIQPYYDREERPKIAVVHNGQLSNDEVLYDEMGLTPIMQGVAKDIDTYAFINVFQDVNKIRRKLNPTDRDVVSPWQRTLTELDGSWAVALYTVNPDVDGYNWHFGRNFLGLTFGIWEDGSSKYLVWSSERDGLMPIDKRSDSRERVMTWEMPLDSSLSLNKHMLEMYRVYSPMAIFNNLRRNITTIKKRSQFNQTSAVVVLSGGLDSTVCAALACRDYKHVRLVHFHYGARAELQETLSVRLIRDRLMEQYPDTDITLDFIDLDFLKNLGGSALTNPDAEIAEGERGMEKAYEWVPARNLAMIGLAAAYCDRHDIGAIILGLNREESGTYRDNSSEFFKSLNEPLALGTNAMPVMVMPVGNYMKHHIVKKGLEIDAPLDLSWSCYHGNATRCGKCGPCTLRQRAFAMNGVQDPVEYDQLDSVAMDMLRKGQAA